jgi:hypothetical protein
LSPAALEKQQKIEIKIQAHTIHNFGSADKSSAAELLGPAALLLLLFCCVHIFETWTRSVLVHVLPLQGAAVAKTEKQSTSSLCVLFGVGAVGWPSVYQSVSSPSSGNSRHTIFAFRSGVFFSLPPPTHPPVSSVTPAGNQTPPPSSSCGEKKKGKHLFLIRLPLAVVGEREKVGRSVQRIVCVASVRSLNETILVNWDRPCFFIPPFGFLFLFPPHYFEWPLREIKVPHTP